MLLQILLAAGYAATLVHSRSYMIPPTSSKTCKTSSHKNVNIGGSVFDYACWGMWKMDTNKDNKVTVEEVHESFQYSVTMEYCRAFFLLRDLNWDGVFDKKDEPLMFDRMDRNRDGRLNLSESIEQSYISEAQLPIAYLSQTTYIQTGKGIKDLTKDDLKNLLSILPHQDNGSVQMSDFLNAWNFRFLATEEAAKRQFKLLNTDGNDVISSLELGQRFKELDENKDGKLQLMEVIQLANN